MSWLGLCDFHIKTFSAGGLDRLARPENPERSLPAALDRGTLLFEVPCPKTGPIDALGYETNDRSMALHVRVEPNGTALLDLTLDGNRAVLAARASRVPVQAPLRIAMSWDLSRGVLQLAVTATGLPETCRVADGECSAALPLGALRAMVLARPSVRWHPTTIYAAVSDHIDPQGLPAGLTAGTPVDTAAGPRPIETLRPGAMVMTEYNGAQPLRWIGQRIVPARGAFTPVRLRAPFLGLRRDLTVAGTQRVVIDGSDVEYLFGTHEILAEARHLLGGPMAAAETSQAFVRLVIPVFEGDEILRLAGCRAQSESMTGTAMDTRRRHLAAYEAAALCSALSATAVSR
ncbi:MAG: Hint domain-containing protein [Pseudomonadota bacterium]